MTFRSMVEPTPVAPDTTACTVLPTFSEFELRDIFRVKRFAEKPDKEKVVNIVSDMLTANGFSEIMCNSLCPSSWYEQSEDFDGKQLVILANPLSSDLNAMRQSLLFGGLNSVSWNLNRQNPDLKLYEFGNCYFYIGQYITPELELKDQSYRLL